MSKHAKPVLVRVWFEDRDGFNLLANDWKELPNGKATFTMPKGNEHCDKLFKTCGLGVRVIVMESSEIEWCITRMKTGNLYPVECPDAYKVECLPLRRYLSQQQPTDQWIVDNNMRVVTR